MTFIQNLFTSRDNNAQGNTYVGQLGRIWWDPDRNALYYSDGNTAGGIPIGTGGSGPGVPGGPTNSVQFNAGGGSFGGTANITVLGNGMAVIGNVSAAWFNGNVSTTGNVIAGNIISNNYLYANGNSIFANISLSGNVNLGNLYIVDQTIYGKNLNANIDITPEGDGWVRTPKIVIDGMAIVDAGNVVEINTPANVGVQFNADNIFADGNILPTANNVSSLGNATNRYTDLWIGSGNINIVDQTLSQNQQIYADNGNLIIANSSGLTFGNFRFYGNTMALANAAANIIVGQVGDTGWLQVDRPLAVDTTGGQTAFSVDSAGRTQIRAFDGTPANSAGALNIVGSSDGAYQNVRNSGGMIHATGPNNSAARVTIDAYGTVAGNSAFVQFIGRAGRGTANTPAPVQAGDMMARFAGVGWIDSVNEFLPTGVATPTAIEMVAIDNYTANTLGSQINVYTAPTGSNVRALSATVQANGISFLNNTITNSGITFRDGTFQNTAYSPTTVVSSVTAATGIGIAPSNTSAVGNITITNIGVITTAGTANQVFVNGANNISAANGAVTLSLPQDIAQGSNVQFYSLTVTDLSITGNVSNVIPSVIDGPIIYVANTAVNYNDINNSGLVTGNAANGNYAGILYDTATDVWDLSIGNSVGIFAGNVYAEYGQFMDKVWVGFGNADPNITYPDASLQADCDVDSYNQIVIQNHNQGANASSDFVAVANNGDDSTFYIDMGMNSNVFNNSNYAVTKPNDGYLYVNGGNLVIATETAAKSIQFVTGGMNSSSYVRGTLSDAGLSMVGNVTANNIISNSIATTNGISAGGNITGGNIVSLNIMSAAGNVSGQNLLTTGVISATGNVTGGNIRTAGTISTSGNVVANYVVTTSTVINTGVSTTGNVTANNISTNSLSATGNITGTNLIAANVVRADTVSVLGNITGGNLLTNGYISTTGNATFGNVDTTGRISVTGNVDAGNVRTVGIVTATGNIGTAGFFIGNGSQLTGIITSAFQTVVANGVSLSYTANASTLTLSPGNNIVITGNATTATANIAVNNNPTFGNLSVVGNITVNGNILTANTTYLANVGNILFSNVSPLPTAQPGVMEFDGRVLYFTAQDQERGIVPAQQFYVLNVDRGLTYATTTPQSLFGVGAHVSNSTRYWFRIKTTVSRAAGTNNTAFTLGWRGTATPNTITYTVDSTIGAVNTVKPAYQYEIELVANFTNQIAITTTSNPPDSVTVIITGIIDVGAAGVGYLDPYISWTGAVAPGAVTVESLSNFQIYPLGVTGINTNVGNWA